MSGSLWDAEGSCGGVDKRGPFFVDTHLISHCIIWNMFKKFKVQRFIDEKDYITKQCS